MLANSSDDDERETLEQLQERIETLRKARTPSGVRVTSFSGFPVAAESKISRTPRATSGFEVRSLEPSDMRPKAQNLTERFAQASNETLTRAGETAKPVESEEEEDEKLKELNLKYAHINESSKQSSESLEALRARLAAIKRENQGEKENLGSNSSVGKMTEEAVPIKKEPILPTAPSAAEISLADSEALVQEVNKLGTELDTKLAAIQELDRQRQNRMSFYRRMHRLLNFLLVLVFAIAIHWLITQPFTQRQWDLFYEDPAEYLRTHSQRLFIWLDGPGARFMPF